MTRCGQCGHELGVGRFCTNCGHPAAAAGPAAPDAAVADPPGDAPSSGGQHTGTSHRRGSAAGWVPWVAALTVMLLVGALGLWLLLGQDGPPTATDTSGEPAVRERPSRDDRTPEGRATVSPVPRADPENLAGSVTVRAPRPAAPARDIDGDRVRFVAAHLVDADPETCWRTPGDATGESITFAFDGPTELSEVGLVNGYAKTARDSRGVLDWYTGNRRTVRVEWTFDDDTRVTQDLRQDRRMQTVSVDDVVTEQVTMRLVRVTPPGPGRASRDYTAISEVRLVGAPA